MFKYGVIVWMVLLLMCNIYAWEVNTHRAIDKTALKKTNNLKLFMEDTGLKTDEDFGSMQYEGYDTTYFNYITSINKTMKELGLTFGEKPNYLMLIEAGSILEDALWPGWNWWPYANGRFLNHFLNPQYGDDGYAGYGNAWYWATQHSGNKYGYAPARDYYKKAFSSVTEAERTTYRAKMFVSIGHLMHLFNDMNVPAHTRSDPHAGDPLEVWMKGGKNHEGSTGFYIGE